MAGSDRGLDRSTSPHNHSRTSATAVPLLSPAAGRGLARHASAQHILRPVAEPLVKRCSRIFFEDGLVAALQEIADSQPPEQRQQDDDDDDDGAAVAVVPLMHQLARQLARQALRLIDVLGRAQLYVQPQQRVATVALNAVRLSQTRDWSRSLIRAMAWHPQCMRLAVAACDDSVRIYTDSVGVVPVLKV